MKGDTFHIYEAGRVKDRARRYRELLAIRDEIESYLDDGIAPAITAYSYLGINVRGANVEDQALNRIELREIIEQRLEKLKDDMGANLELDPWELYQQSVCIRAKRIQDKKERNRFIGNVRHSATLLGRKLTIDPLSMT